MEKCGDKTVFRNNTKERQLKREEALLGEKLLEQEIHQVCFWYHFSYKTEFTLKLTIPLSSWLNKMCQRSRNQLSAINITVITQFAWYKHGTASYSIALLLFMPPCELYIFNYIDIHLSWTHILGSFMLCLHEAGCVMYSRRRVIRRRWVNDNVILRQRSTRYIQHLNY